MNCDKCGGTDRIAGERFCKACRKEVLKILSVNGHFRPCAPIRRGRTRDQRQDMSREPGPSYENAVRAMEDGRLISDIVEVAKPS